MDQLHKHTELEARFTNTHKYMSNETNRSIWKTKYLDTPYCFFFFPPEYTLLLFCFSFIEHNYIAYEVPDQWQQLHLKRTHQIAYRVPCILQSYKRIATESLIMTVTEEINGNSV